MTAKNNNYCPYCGTFVERTTRPLDRDGAMDGHAGMVAGRITVILCPGCNVHLKEKQLVDLEKAQQLKEVPGNGRD